MSLLLNWIVFDQLTYTKAAVPSAVRAIFFLERPFTGSNFSNESGTTLDFLNRQ